MGGATEEEAEELERLQPDHLAVGAEHLEDGPHAALQQNMMATVSDHGQLDDSV